MYVDITELSSNPDLACRGAGHQILAEEFKRMNTVLESEDNKNIDPAPVHYETSRKVGALALRTYSY
ncbi:MAG: hypothetical protein NVSMB46_00610 [Candidatus Saccharimonadales bacterium]